MDWDQLGFATLCLAVGAFVQSSIGFGMGIVSVPLLVSNGCSLPIALAVLMPNVLLQTAVSCWRLRAHLPWRDSWRLVVWRLTSLPLGIYLLTLVSARGIAASRMLLGVTLVVLLLAPLGRGPTRTSVADPGGSDPANDGDIAERTAVAPAAPPGPVWTCLAGLTSGLLMGLNGMGGPPLMAWVMRQDWPNQRQRAFLWLSFLLALPVQITLMTWRFGSPWRDGLVVGSCAIPVVLLVTWLVGTWADNWSKERLRWGMRLFLFLLALRLILFPGLG